MGKREAAALACVDAQGSGVRGACQHGVFKHHDLGAVVNQAHREARAQCLYLALRGLHYEWPIGGLRFLAGGHQNLARH
ncbi:hypothetical protein D3C85_1891130 [compost metagenome]